MNLLPMGKSASNRFQMDGTAAAGAGAGAGAREGPLQGDGDGNFLASDGSVPK